jgi:glycosyltransferase involved in cell wall biosynthesis
MQFGAPTLSSNATSMPEVAGDAALLLTPHDPEPWTQAMLDLASDQGKRHRMANAARARAKPFYWERSAASMLAIYEEATRAPKRAGMNQTTSHTGDPLVENVG